jgi:hypothetical protein
MTETLEKQAISPTAMRVEDAVRLLAKVSGQPIEADMLEEDFAEGAPQNPDGTINLVNYGAWLVKEAAKRVN